MLLTLAVVLFSFAARKPKAELKKYDVVITHYSLLAQESQGHCHELTKKIAKCGCYGKYPNNVERDLMSSLELPIAPWPK